MDLPTAQRETSDVALRPLLVGAGGVLLVLLVVGVLTVWLYPGSRDGRVVRTTGLPDFPAPQLQPSPSADMARFHAEQMRQLNGVWWVDRDRGVVHQPIADAMRRLAATGIADWPTTPARAQGGPAR